jgi:large subunit ribosomal protein L1
MTTKEQIMAKTKQDWLKEAKELGLEVTPKDKIADIKAAIEAAAAKPAKTPAEKSLKGTPVIAKAGKRSRKGQEEAEAKTAKEARKHRELDEPAAEETKKPKSGPAPRSRSVLERRGRKYREAHAKIDRTRTYELDEAIKLMEQTAATKFDSTVELHLRLNVDPKQSDQNIRDVVSLPHGSGKSVRIAVFAPTEQHEAAKAAGADIVGEQDFLKQLDKGQINFDVLISMPQVMGQLGKYAKLLGPKGLMPNPKSGTVTNNVAEAVRAAKTGRVEFRVDAQGIIHVGIGKVSFGSEKLAANAKAVVDAVKSAKPASVKSGYLISAYLSTTMGPSARLSL